MTKKIHCPKRKVLFPHARSNHGFFPRGNIFSNLPLKRLSIKVIFFTKTIFETKNNIKYCSDRNIGRIFLRLKCYLKVELDFFWYFCDRISIKNFNGTVRFQMFNTFLRWFFRHWQYFPRTKIKCVGWNFI